ncbi:MAG: hypothetical protein AAF182_00660 [Pseudomonadota bacterium]
MINPKETPTLLDDEIPAKFKDPATGDLKMDVLLKSYKELEQKLSSQDTVPTADDLTPTDTPPTEPGEYCIDCSHGMFDADEEVNRKLHEKGFSNAQAQAVYDLAAEKMVPAVQQLAQDVKAEKELERLINHFGGAEKWTEVSRQLLAFGEQNLPADVLENLSSSFEGVLALHRMMKSQEPNLRAQTQPQNLSGEDDLKAMMRDPRYWKEKDPKFIAEVTEGFKKIYS